MTTKVRFGYYDMELLEHYVLARISQLQNDPEKIQECFGRYKPGSRQAGNPKADR